MDQVDPKAAQRTPAPNHIHSGSEHSRNGASRWGGLPSPLCELVEQDHLDPAVAEQTNELVGLVEQHDRFKIRLIDSYDQIEEGLMRAAYCSILVAFDDQDTGALR